MDRACSNNHMLVLCTHRYALYQLMQMFRRDGVDGLQNPSYCWTAAMELEIRKSDLHSILYSKLDDLDRASGTNSAPPAYEQSAHSGSMR